MKQENYILNGYQNSEGNYDFFNVTNSNSDVVKYNDIMSNISENQSNMLDTIEMVSQWFLNVSTMSNKKLQKLCYYAYCWYIVFFNDIESVIDKKSSINTLCPECFQAWIHGPVLPKLYYKYKKYGWQNIPKISYSPKLSEKITSLLEQVWEAYGELSADELEELSHQELPWKKARRGMKNWMACSNEISPYDILIYYSSLE